ncbi:hypothetical protein [Bacillus cereus group sp. BfR-BA-01383]|uniref:hypothetical protein n=1 Tax=Bacillus cereus group sp. BfR-BA-01383 TaxID=2920327 RepID=UPI001F579CA6|nr:hypothetical protein [Bacillus cereus group sp. BfR-BA-01383]
MKWKGEDIIFETMREAEVWADSLANEMYGRVFDGYETPDYKIAYALSFFLAQEREYVVHTEKHFEKGGFIYRVWIAERERE